MKTASPIFIVLAILSQVAIAQEALKPSTHPPVLTLREAIERAEVQNKDLLIAKQEFDKQKARQRRALALYLPKLKLGSTFVVNVPQAAISFNNAGQNISVVTQPTWAFDSQLTLSQPLLDLNALASIRDAELEADRIALMHADIRNGLHYQVARLYLLSLRAQNAARVSEANVARAQKLLKYTQDKYQRGLARLSDSRRGELELETAREGLRNAQAAHEHAIAALGTLIGETYTFLVSPSLELAAVEKLDNADNMIEGARTLRRDLQTQRAELQASRASHVGAYANFFPVISASAQGFYTSNDAGLIPTPFRAAFVISGSWNLYDGGDRYGQIREKRAQIQIDQIKVRDLERRIDAEVRGRLVDINTKLASIATLKKKLSLQAEIFSDTQDTYQQGLSDISDFINAGHDLTNFELNHADAVVDLELARLELANVAGRLEDALP